MDHLKQFLRDLATDDARASFAAQCGTSAGHLRNVSHGQKPLAPATCVKVETVSRGVVRRWHLRPEDWHLIWPELIGVSGAPRVRRSKAAAEAQ